MDNLLNKIADLLEKYPRAFKMLSMALMLFSLVCLYTPSLSFLLPAARVCFGVSFGIYFTVWLFKATSKWYKT